MSLHDALNVSLPRCIIGKATFVPRPGELILVVGRLKNFVHEALPSKVGVFRELIKSISLLNRFIHITLPAKLIQRG